MRAPSHIISVFAYFVDSHELLCSVCLCLVQWNKLYVLGRLGFVAERRRDCVQVMCTNGNELSLAADVLM